MHEAQGAISVAGSAQYEAMLTQNVTCMRVLSITTRILCLQVIKVKARIWQKIDINFLLSVFRNVFQHTCKEDDSRVKINKEIKNMCHGACLVENNHLVIAWLSIKEN